MVEIRTLEDYVNWTRQFGYWNYIFRGVSNDTYKMSPSACRRLKNPEDLSGDKLLEINKDLLERARQQGHGKDMTDLDLLAKLQHFGAATCFLDYTSNALVGLYFACKENNSDTNGKVCAMCITPERHPEIVLKEVKQEISGENIDYFFQTDNSGKPVIYFWIPDYGNIRMRAQQSILVFGDIVIPTLSECIILNEKKKAIRAELKILSNIDEEHLFPDFEGFASNNSQEKEYSEFGYVEYMQFASSESFYAATSESLLGRSDTTREHYNKAVEYYNKAEICMEKPVNIYLLMHIFDKRAECYLRNSQFELAIKDCNYLIENSIGIYENYSTPYWIRGKARFELGNYEGSIEDLQQAIKIFPGHGNAYRCLWEVRKKLGQYNEAVNDFDTAIRDMPEFPDYFFMRGEAKMELNQNSDAKLDFQKALEIAIRNNNTEYEEKCLEKLNAAI